MLRLTTALAEVVERPRSLSRLGRARRVNAIRPHFHFRSRHDRLVQVPVKDLHWWPRPVSEGIVLG